MRVTLQNASIGDGLGADVPPVTVAVDEGAPIALAVEGDEQPLLVSMMLGGRLRAEHGEVLIDGVDDLDHLRAVTALVDTPWVAEPTAGVALRTIVMEELSFASRPSSGRAITTFLSRHGLEDYGPLPVRALPATDRIALFSELALLRPGIGMLIVTSPERHGAPAEDWYRSLADIADRGIVVVIVTDVATATSLRSLGARLPSPAAATPES